MSASVTERCSCGASFNYRGDSPLIASLDFRANHRHDDSDPVTLDSPTIAVPVSAVDELRDQFNRSLHGTFGSAGVVIPAVRVGAFLAAVDEAAR